ncbi:uracil-DNA glycosylase [Candidatus Bipolaricaulota bacterium]|nr:uracil-DNA glycosylase [Candidatus Bipolaricaulota bacterium]
MSALTELSRQMASCQACELAQQRNKVVPGEGADDADLLFIGEAPGFNEDQQGKPFVGAAGSFLDQLLASIGLSRGDVYIANVIKCQPAGNRDPLPGEIAACKPWLDQQIELIRPKIIVTLGRFSLARYFTNETIGKVHGRPRKVGDIMCFPMYHPAAALHQGSLRKVIEEDMLKLPALLKDLETCSDTSDDGGQQLALF